MKQILFVAIILSLILLSCKTKKAVVKQDSPEPAQVEQVAEVKTEEEKIAPEPVVETPIVIKTEDVSVAEDEDQSKGDFAFYVIFGSFSKAENAINYKAQLATQGFSSVLLTSETGFIRVAVHHTNSENEARNLVLDIRKRFPEHSDAWLLKKK